jgi:hypothetical protein
MRKMCREEKDMFHNMNERTGRTQKYRVKKENNTTQGAIVRSPEKSDRSIRSFTIRVRSFQKTIIYFSYIRNILLHILAIHKIIAETAFTVKKQKINGNKIRDHLCIVVSGLSDRRKGTRKIEITT